MSRRLIGSLIAVAVTLAVMPATARAHSELISTSPQDGAVLDDAPSEVVMTFEGELVAAGSGFVVTDATGTEVATGGLDLAVAERNVLRGMVEIAAPGTYTVTWTSVAPDGHETGGQFTFTYGGDGPATTPIPGEAPDTAVAPATPPALVLIGAALVAAAALIATRRSLAGRLVLVALPLLLAACVDQGRPDDCGASTVELRVILTADALQPSGPSVCRDQEVLMVVDSRVDGVLHIHGYDAQVPATSVEADETLELAFTASRSGQFPMELHTDDNPQGVSVGIFTVHEP